MKIATLIGFGVSFVGTLFTFVKVIQQPSLFSIIAFLFWIVLSTYFGNKLSKWATINIETNHPTALSITTTNQNLKLMSVTDCLPWQWTQK